MTYIQDKKSDNDRRSIFVSIPCFCDPQLRFTLRDLFEKAKYPDRLFVGVYWQCDLTEDSTDFGSDLPLQWANRVRVLMVHKKHARGPTYARHVTHSLYQGEKYILNIDSHTRFTAGWDKVLIDMLEQLVMKKRSKRVILTTYPSGYEFDPSIPEKAVIPNQNVLHFAGPLELQALRFDQHDGMLR